MVIGSLTIVCRIHGAASLKDKRRVVKRILAKTREKFNVSVSEVGDNDVHGSARLAFVMVGSDGSYVNSALDKMLNFIDDLCLMEIVDHDMELMTASPWK